MKTNKLLAAKNVNDNSGGDFPLKIRRGGIEVKIYHRVEKQRYDCFTLAYYEKGLRHLKPFSSLDAAKDEAQIVLQQLILGEADLVPLSTHDRLAFTRAQSLLGQINVPVDVAVAEYAHIVKLLSGKATPTEAVQGFLKNLASAPVPKRVDEVVAELLATRQAQNSSPRHVKDLALRLTRFTESFQCNIGDITAADISNWLHALKLSPRSVNNYRCSVSNLFGFASQHKYICRDANPIETVPEVKEPQKLVEIYTAKDLEALLSASPTDFLPFIVIAAFGGLRSSEIERLRWEHIGKEEIEVPPGSFRVKSTRLIKMHATLRAWIKLLRKPNGPVIEYKNVSNKLHDVTVSAGVKPFPNALRHSFASYSLALDKNPEALAYHMGNSKSMLNKHYRRLIGAKQAKAWFSLTPKKLNLVLLPSCLKQAETAVNHPAAVA